MSAIVLDPSVARRRQLTPGVRLQEGPMPGKPPKAEDLSASREWVRDTFGLHGQYRKALRQVERSLAAIDLYERSFLLAKVDLLSCLERWSELAALLRQLAKRFPFDLEVRNNIADLFLAHGDWRACLAALNTAGPLVRASSDRWLVDRHYDVRLACLYALGQKAEAERCGRSILNRLPRNSSARVTLRHIRSGRLKIDPWAPKSAPYLRGLRGLAT
jgi:tetratricopeptide (TPR) repeat protein